MTSNYIKFHKATFCYEKAGVPIFENITLHAIPGWSGVVGGNGAGKTTLLKLATGLLEACSGFIERPIQTAYCAQRTDDPPENLDALLMCHNKSAQILKGKLGLEADWRLRWQTLSHGERKRAQIACTIWREPDLLAVDEPTNHLDTQARQMLIDALHSFKGVGLLVSHDRQLLDSLCLQCLFIEPPKVVARPGGYTNGRQIAAVEQAALQKQRGIKRQNFRKIKGEVGKRKDAANQANRRRSKKGIGKKDHDAKQKINTAILTGKDGRRGRLLRQLDGRLERTKRELEELKVKKESPLGIWLPGSISTRNLLLNFDRGELRLGENKILRYPRLQITPDDRIGITGINGSGKSTLIGKIVSVLNAPSENITYIPQEIDLSMSRQTLKLIKKLPNTSKGHLMTIVSRLGSDPQRLLDSITPSPGETRKLLLALGMTRQPHIIIMDEPTNHMDLPSIECLEKALKDCPCSLVLISHDPLFLDCLTQKRWHLVKSDRDIFSLKMSG